MAHPRSLCGPAALCASPAEILGLKYLKNGRERQQQGSFEGTMRLTRRSVLHLTGAQALLTDLGIDRNRI